MTEEKCLVQHKNLVVLLEPNEDPKVFAEDGTDVSEHCVSITLHPGKTAWAIMCSHDTQGKHYTTRNNSQDDLTIASYTTNVVNITGTFIARGAIK